MIFMLSEPKLEKHGNFKGKIGNIDFSLKNNKYNS